MRSQVGWASVVLVACAYGFAPGCSPLARPQSSRDGRRGRGTFEMATAADEQGYLSWLSDKIEKYNRLPPVQIRRARLNRDFAVLLMRSSYQVNMTVMKNIHVWAQGCRHRTLPLEKFRKMTMCVRVFVCVMPRIRFFGFSFLC